jgi:hypothetical protein
MRRAWRTERGAPVGGCYRRVVKLAASVLAVTTLSWTLNRDVQTYGACYEPSLSGSVSSGWGTTTASITPSTTGTDDVVQITLHGCWGDLCVPNQSSISVVASNVYFDAILNYPPGIYCAAVLTSWQQTQYVGPLTAGTYKVYARPIGDPRSPPVYGLVTSFAVINPVGSLKVTIEPVDAVLDGGQWQVDGGAWQNSGAMVEGLSVGNQTVHFNTITDWTSPVDQVVTINADVTTTATGTYTFIDMIPDWWRLQYFGSTTGIVACASCDPDGDGLPNWKEFRANTDPTNSASSFRIAALVSTNHDLLITLDDGFRQDEFIAGCLGRRLRFLPQQLCRRLHRHQYNRNLD